MNEDILYELSEYAGEVAVGDLVVYAKDSDFSKLGDYKKDIWLVKDIENFRSKSAQVTLTNISKNDTEFKTNFRNVLDIGILQDLTDNWKKFFSMRSLSAYANRSTQARYNSGVSAYKFDTSDYTVLKENKDKPKTGEVKMNMMNKVIDTNVNAAKTGAVISAGNTLNKVVKQSVRTKVPRKYRKLVDSPAGDILVANVASFAVQNFAKTNQKALVATDAMMTAAMVEFMNSFNLETMISDVLSQVNIDELMSTE